MPNFKSLSFKMAVLQGGGQNLPSPCVCYPKDPMWNRVKLLMRDNERSFYSCLERDVIMLAFTEIKPTTYVNEITVMMPFSSTYICSSQILTPAAFQIKICTSDFQGCTSMYVIVVLSLSTKFIKNGYQNLPVQPIFRDKA